MDRTLEFNWSEEEMIYITELRNKICPDWYNLDASEEEIEQLHLYLRVWVKRGVEDLLIEKPMLFSIAGRLDIVVDPYYPEMMIPTGSSSSAGNGGFGSGSTNSD